MKTKCIYTLTLALFYFLINDSYAQQWSGTGDIYYNGGKVGIGTSTPGTLFEVNNGDGTMPSYFQVNPFSGNTQVKLLNTTNDLSSDKNAIMTVTSKRSVGSSSTGGASMFIINYDASSVLSESSYNQSSMYLRNDDPYTSKLGFWNNNSDYSIYDGSNLLEINSSVGNKFVRSNISTNHADHIRWEFDGSEKMRINSSGSVGIGTTSPGSGTAPSSDVKLHVNGDITMTGGRSFPLTIIIMYTHTCNTTHPHLLQGSNTLVITDINSMIMAEQEWSYSKVEM